MNAQALIQDRYSLSDFEQIVGFIEQVLSTYTGAVIALFVVIASIAACRAVLDMKGSRTKQHSAVTTRTKSTLHQLNDREPVKSGFKRVSLDKSSAY